MVDNALDRLGQRQLSIMSGLLSWLQHLQSRRKRSRLRLCESLSLGEKRFVAVVEFDSLQFLVGGTSNSITLLSKIPPCAPEDPR
jgi:flagellar biogenesis protein FliO